MRSSRGLTAVLAASFVLPAAAAAAAAPPTAPGAPWPQMRHDARNTGATPLRATAHRGDRPWLVRTRRGIFASPVVGPGDRVYLGSADGTFNALDRRGRRVWRYTTGGIIDAAGVLGDDGTVTIGSGDERLYRFDVRRRARPRVRWALKATLKPATGQLVNWWEGNVVLGPDGNLYAGNTGGAIYSITRGGTVRWTYQTGNSVWTTPAFARDGTSYWGSLDLNVYALDAQGRKRWSTPTIGYVVGSPALSADERTLYVTSFDSRLYALDARTGLPKWSFATDEHVYASPALLEDADGAVRSIVIASADGSVYAVAPDGTLRWRYDTGDVIRSSPVIGRKPAGEDGHIVYVGAGDGTLYALDAETGRRRWSYDTTLADPVLRDRNDLNSSPALGTRGVYIGSEDGGIRFVPYDWCLRHADTRCSRDPGQPQGGEVDRVFAMTAGGSTLPGTDAGTRSPATTLAARLIVRRGGVTEDAAMLGGPDAGALVTTDPPVPMSAQLSGDGHLLHLVPDGLLDPATTYRVRVRGTYGAGGAGVGNLAAGATRTGTFDTTLALRTAPSDGRPLPLAGPARGRTGALRISRLAVPLPSYLPSVNQIGFDSYDLLAGVVRADAERLLLWIVGGRPGPRGTTVADPAQPFAFAMAGQHRGDDVLLRGDGLAFTFSFGEVPTRRFELRGRLRRDLTMAPGAALYSEVFCPGVPNYGVLLVAVGLCNTGGVLPVSGTFVTGDPGRTPAAAAPRGVRAGRFALTRPSLLQAGAVTADITVARSSSWPAKDHVAAILLVDEDSGQPVNVDYRHGTTVTRDARGNPAQVRLVLPRGTSLPSRVRAYLMADVHPLATTLLPLP